MGADPLWPFKTPQWYLLYLLAMMPRLQAEEVLEGMVVSTQPHKKSRDQQGVIASFRAVASPPAARKARRERKPIIEFDPIKARDYFQKIGVEVQEKKRDRPSA